MTGRIMIVEDDRSMGGARDRPAAAWRADRVDPGREALAQQHDDVDVVLTDLKPRPQWSGLVRAGCGESAGCPRGRADRVWQPGDGHGGHTGRRLRLCQQTCGHGCPGAGA